MLSLTLLLIWALTLPPVLTSSTSPIETPLYTYSLTSDSAYSVSLLPNDVYPNATLGENAVYPANLMKDLNVKFVATYQASLPSSTIACTYSVKAKVRGFQTLGGTQAVIYSNEYQLAGPKTVSQDNASSLDVIQNLTINPAIYIDYSEKAQKQIASSLNREVQILFEGTFETTTEYGSVTEPFTSTLTMPLGSEIFTISKSNPYAGQNAFTQKQSQSVLTNPLFYVWLLLPLAAALLLVTLFFFSRLPSPPEAFKAQLKKILRRYSNRLVEIADIPAGNGQTDVRLSNFSSLLRLAEEIQKPVCYKSDRLGLPEDGCFYVFDSHYRYCYQEDKKTYTQ